jgi:hypothetical protein
MKRVLFMRFADQADTTQVLQEAALTPAEEQSCKTVFQKNVAQAKKDHPTITNYMDYAICAGGSDETDTCQVGSLCTQNYLYFVIRL